MIAIGIAALLAVGVVAFVGARLAQSPSAPPPTEAAPQPGPTWQESQPAEPQRPAPPETVTHTATVTQPPAPPRPAPPAPSRPSGDLGLPTPMSSPSRAVPLTLPRSRRAGRYRPLLSRLHRVFGRPVQGLAAEFFVPNEILVVPDRGVGGVHDRCASRAEGFVDFEGDFHAGSQAG
jgi:hypothetical protein